jgi:hypothetical protein
MRTLWLSCYPNLQFLLMWLVPNNTQDSKYHTLTAVKVKVKTSFSLNYFTVVKAQKSSEYLREMFKKYLRKFPRIITLGLASVNFHGNFSQQCFVYCARKWFWKDRVKRNQVYSILFIINIQYAVEQSFIIFCPTVSYTIQTI